VRLRPMQEMLSSFVSWSVSVSAAGGERGRGSEGVLDVWTTWFALRFAVITHQLSRSSRQEHLCFHLHAFLTNFSWKKLQEVKLDSSDWSFRPSGYFLNQICLLLSLYLSLSMIFEVRKRSRTMSPPGLKSGENPFLGLQNNRLRGGSRTMSPPGLKSGESPFLGFQNKRLRGGCLNGEIIYF